MSEYEPVSCCVVVERKSIASHWMDASHVSWFNSLFDQVQSAIANGEWVGKEAEESYRCIEIIGEKESR